MFCANLSLSPKNRSKIGYFGFLVLLLLAFTPPASVRSDALPLSQPQKPTVIANQTIQTLPLTATLEIGKELIELEVAKTPEQQEIGLMNRRSLADNRGMVFVFEPPRIALFWMKNTLIPLDMIFLANGKIVSLHKNVPPCKKDPCPVYGTQTTVVDQVIELRAGRAQELGLQKGDSLKVKFKSRS